MHHDDEFTAARMAGPLLGGNLPAQLARHQVAVTYGSVLAGIVQLVVAHETLGYWSDVLVNTGSATLLLAPLYALSAALGRRVEHVRVQATDQIDALRAEVEESASDMRSDIDTLRTQVQDRLRESDAQQDLHIAKLRAVPSLIDVRSALRHAIDERVVSASGPRVRIAHADVYVYGRFRLEADHVNVDLERRNGSVFASKQWVEAMSATDLMLEVAAALRAESLLPSDFDAALPFAQLGDLLGESTKQKRRLALLEDVSDVIETCGQWTIHDWGLVGWPEESMLPYPIDAHRFDDSDWHRHLAEKEWVDLDSFDQAMTTARLLLAAGNLLRSPNP